MNKLLGLLLVFTTVLAQAADVKISQLPLGSAATTGVNDSFPYVAAGVNITKRLTLYDIANIPTIIAQYAALASSPTFTGTVTAAGFVGPITGTATNATNIGTTALSTNASFFPTFVPASTSGFQAAKINSGFSFNPSTNTLTATNFAGNATTATALAANPTDCSANQYATAIAANGNLTCAQAAFSQLTGSVAASQMPALTGDITTSAGAVATTLATVNSNVGTFGDATHVSQVTVNAKGLVTAASNVTITAAPPSGYTARNFLINGAFDLWQRNTTGTNANGAKAYVSADRWYAPNNLGASAVVTLVQVAGVQAGSTYGAKVYVSTAPSSPSTGAVLVQLAETSTSLQMYSQTVSAAAYVKAFGNVNQVTLKIPYNTSQASALSPSSLGSNTCTVNSSTFTLCKVEGVSVSTTPTVSGVVGFSITATGVSTGNVSDINQGFIAEQAILNLGSTAATFVRAGAEFGEEVRMAQRFFQKSYDLATSVGTASTTNGAIIGYFPSAVGSLYINVRYGVNMVWTGTVTLYNTNSGATGTCRDGGNSADISVSAIENGNSGFIMALGAFGTGGTPQCQYATNAEF